MWNWAANNKQTLGDPSQFILLYTPARVGVAREVWWRLYSAETSSINTDSPGEFVSLRFPEIYSLLSGMGAGGGVYHISCVPYRPGGAIRMSCLVDTSVNSKIDTAPALSSMLFTLDAHESVLGS